MSEIPFTVSARTAKLIGQENFANADGAIVELVKNTYDADSRNCFVIFENHGECEKNPSIYIIDNGIGMTDEVIVKNWMTIGTDDKLQNYQSEKGRVKTGAKGIGRFALNRLGVLTEMYTLSKKTLKGYVWKVDWRGFDTLGATITDVKADLQEDKELSLEAVIQKRFSHFESFMKVFSLQDFKNGTIIKISNLNDEWGYDPIKRLYDNLEVLIPPQEQSSFDIYLYSTKYPEEFGIVSNAYYDDYDYKVKAKYLGNENRDLRVEITRNELDVEVLSKDYAELFEAPQMKIFPFLLENFKDKTFILNTSLNSLKGFADNVPNELINKIGKFDFTFYFIKNTVSDDVSEGDKKKYPYKSFISANRKAWLKKFGGIKVFRDEFRVRPYGENGEDWLKLGERQAQSPGGAGQKLGGYRIRPNQVSGTINISRISNSSFQDKSGREGIQENEVFELFKNVLLEIISFFERDRNIVMYNLSLLAKNRFKSEEEKRRAQELANEINSKRKEREEKQRQNSEEDKHTNRSNEQDTNEEALAKGVTSLTEELEEKEQEIKLLRNLASTGLIISSFAHEVKSLRTRLIPRTQFLIQELRKYIKEENLKNVERDDNPFYMLELIQDEDKKLKHWLDYSLNSLKRDRRKRTNVNIGDYFQRFKSTWEKAVEQRNVKIYLDGTNDSYLILRAFEVDLDSIFNNLLSNSLNSLKDKRIDNKEIRISWKSIGDFIEIIFYDNGRGLAKEYRSHPDEIFNSFETSKKDKTGAVIGTGLGLYIVKSIVEEYSDASVKIQDIDDSFSLKFLFKTRKCDEI